MMNNACHGDMSRVQVPGIKLPNAPEKIKSFPGRLLFSQQLCYFSCVLFGGYVFLYI